MAEDMRRLAIAMLAGTVAVSAAGVTIHRSFHGGYPAAVSEARQNSAEAGASITAAPGTIHTTTTPRSTPMPKGTPASSAAAKPLSDKAAAAW